MREILLDELFDVRAQLPWVVVIGRVTNVSERGFRAHVHGEAMEGGAIFFGPGGLGVAAV